MKDVMQGAYEVFMPVSEAKKKEMIAEFYTKKAPVFLQAMEEKLKSKKTHEFLIGENYTLADFYFIGVWRAVVANPVFPDFTELMTKTPLLCEYYEKKNKLY